MANSSHRAHLGMYRRYLLHQLLHYASQGIRQWLLYHKQLRNAMRFVPRCPAMAIYGYVNQ